MGVEGRQQGFVRRAFGGRVGDLLVGRLTISDQGWPRSVDSSIWAVMVATKTTRRPLVAALWSL
ncbi:hypothetical protein [Streptomyces sp. NPDC001137]|uniref:hypothetical protein n=1 Tax=Streptomyces sp. NPDC001137 TaxID=3154378 RepID=UPI003323CD5F